MLLEGQLAEVTDELELLEVETSSLEVSGCSEDSPDPVDDPPPLQEITRRLKIKTIRKKRSFFIFFP